MTPSTVTKRAGKFIRKLKGADVATTCVTLVGAIVFAAASVGCGASGSVSVMSLGVGECVQLDLPFRSAELDRVERVPCDGSHAAEVLHVGELNASGDQEYPRDELRLFLDVLAACVQPPGPGQISIFEARTGEVYSSSSQEVVPVAPDLRTWEQARGKFVCLMLTGAGSARV